MPDAVWHDGLYHNTLTHRGIAPAKYPALSPQQPPPFIPKYTLMLEWLAGMHMAGKKWFFHDKNADHNPTDRAKKLIAIYDGIPPRMLQFMGHTFKPALKGQLPLLSKTAMDTVKNQYQQHYPVYSEIYNKTLSVDSDYQKAIKSGDYSKFPQVVVHGPETLRVIEQTNTAILKSVIRAAQQHPEWGINPSLIPPSHQELRRRAKLENTRFSK